MRQVLVLVTGATGFIGRHLVNALLAAGHKVRALVRESSDYSELEAQGVQVMPHDLPDGHRTAKACRQVDIIVNLAGKMGGPSVSLSEMRAINVSAVEALMKACQQSNVRHFIHCSTPGVVGMVGVAPECMPYRPTGAYERTKSDGEKAVLNYHKSGKVPATIIRPDFVYGPGDAHKLRMFRAIKDGTFPIIGGGRSVLHPTYVEDVVRGIMLTLDNPTAHWQVFNIAGPRPVPVSELAREVAEAIGVEAPKRRIPTIPAKVAALGAEIAGKALGRAPVLTRYQVDFFTRDHASDTSKAQQMLGYRPIVDLPEGIGRTVKWYRERGLL